LISDIPIYRTPLNIGYSKAIGFTDNLNSVVTVLVDFPRSSSESEEEQIYVEEEDPEAPLLVGQMPRKMLPIVLTAPILLSVAGASRFASGSVPVSRALWGEATKPCRNYNAMSGYGNP
jgi:hypothetical protein